MSLHIRVNSQTQVVKPAFVMTGGPVYSWQGDNLHYQAVNNDLMLQLLDNGHCWYVSAPARSISELCSFRTNQALFDETLTVSSQPLRSVREPYSSYEERYYGSVSRGILIFLSVLSGRSFNAPSYQHEHGCEHLTFSGELVAKQGIFPRDAGSYTFCGVSLETLHFPHLSVPTAARVNSLNPLNCTIECEQDSGNTYVDLEHFLSHLEGTSWVWPKWWNGSLFIQTLSDVQTSRTTLGFTVSYSMDVSSSIPNYQHYVWRASVHIPFRCAAPSLDPVVDTVYHPLFGDPCVYTYDFSVAEPYTGEMHWELTGRTYNHMRAWPIFLSYPTMSTTAEHASVVRSVDSIRASAALGDFAKAVKDSWDDIVPACMFSTVDAFKSAEGSLETNILQNLQKLPGLSGMLPQVREAIDVLGRIARRDLSFATIRDILDLATSTVLQANFEWRPFHNVLTQYLPDLASTYSSFSDNSKSCIGYGTYSKKIFNDLGRGVVTLLVRTKVVMDSSPSGLLSALIGADAVGILPKASNLWDLIPFSFVANWFTGVGEGIRRAEYSLLMATIPAYFCHTYTLTSPLTSEELDSFEVSSFGDDPASLRLYFRDITLYSPVPRDSRFGFGIPSDFPPLGTFGSLLYQLIFS